MRTALVIALLCLAQAAVASSNHRGSQSSLISIGEAATFEFADNAKGNGKAFGLGPPTTFAFPRVTPIVLSMFGPARKRAALPSHKGSFFDDIPGAASTHAFTSTTDSKLRAFRFPVGMPQRFMCALSNSDSAVTFDAVVSAITVAGLLCVSILWIGFFSAPRPRRSAALIAVLLFSRFAVVNSLGATFTIANTDRIGGKTAMPVTFSLTPANNKNIAAGGSLTIGYPPGFFASGITPSFSGCSACGSVTGFAFSATSSSNTITITLSGAAVIPDSACTFTMTGLTMGAAGVYASGTIDFATSDPESKSVAAGTIGGKVDSPTMTMPQTERYANKAGGAATISFTTSAGGLVPVGSTITLNFPSGYWATSPLPNAEKYGTNPDFDGEVITGTTFKFNVKGAILAASTAITITITGITMGPAAMAVAASSVFITTDADADPAPTKISSQLLVTLTKIWSFACSTTATAQLHFAFHIRWHNTIAEWDPKSPVVPGNQNNIMGALVHS